MAIDNVTTTVATCLHCLTHLTKLNRKIYDHNCINTYIINLYALSSESRVIITPSAFVTVITPFLTTT